jgi:hypothetical protein
VLFPFFFWRKRRCFDKNTPFHLKKRAPKRYFSKQSLYSCAFFSLVLGFGFLQSSP